MATPTAPPFPAPRGAGRRGIGRGAGARPLPPDPARRRRRARRLLLLLLLLAVSWWPGGGAGDDAAQVPAAPLLRLPLGAGHRLLHVLGRQRRAGRRRRRQEGEREAPFPAASPRRAAGRPRRVRGGGGALPRRSSPPFPLYFYVSPPAPSAFHGAGGCSVDFRPAPAQPRRATSRAGGSGAARGVVPSPGISSLRGVLLPAGEPGRSWAGAASGFPLSLCFILIVLIVLPPPLSLLWESVWRCCGGPSLRERGEVEHSAVPVCVGQSGAMAGRGARQSLRPITLLGKRNGECADLLVPPQSQELPATFLLRWQSELCCKRSPRGARRWAEGEEQSAPRLSRAAC